MGPPLHVNETGCHYVVVRVCMYGCTKSVITGSEILAMLTFINPLFKYVATAITKQNCVPICKRYRTAKLKI